MENYTVTLRTAEEKPKYQTTAAELLTRCREFYQDPANEEAFREWKAQRERKVSA